MYCSSRSLLSTNQIVSSPYAPDTLQQVLRGLGSPNSGSSRAENIYSQGTMTLSANGVFYIILAIRVILMLF